jgi:hypothetical protein
MDQVVKPLPIERDLDALLFDVDLVNERQENGADRFWGKHGISSETSLPRLISPPLLGNILLRIIDSTQDCQDRGIAASQKRQTAVVLITAPTSQFFAYTIHR